ncbi:MAG: cysteine desulfurase [Clostridiales bacterium]|nr:cysteine desulfurase [Clostridiales bacterium]
MTEIYLDNSATTKPHEEVISAMVSSMEHGYFNPSSLYRPGFAVEKEQNAVRQRIEKKVHSDDCQVIFTSGGTEANNLAILGHLKTLRNRGKVLLTAIEHSSIRDTRQEIEKMGFSVEIIPVDQKGRVDLKAYHHLLDDQVVLICAMQVNNEIGTIQPIEEMTGLREEYAPGAAFHVDGVQGFLRVPFWLDQWNVQSYALSGHKIHGGKGVGALVKRKNHRIAPLFHGGGQEKNIRSGTENTYGIIGLGKAIDIFPEEKMQEMKQWKNDFWKELKEYIPTAIRLGPQEGEECDSPHIINIAFSPIMGETMLHALEAKGIYVSTGSACSSKKQKMAHTLEAIGTDVQLGKSAIRISLNPYMEKEGLTVAAQRMKEVYAFLSSFQKR